MRTLKIRTRMIGLGCLAATTLLASACGGSQKVEDVVAEGREQGGNLLADATLEAIIASPHRSEENRARDAARHPLETLQFFGLKPDDTVIEISPGRGWYAEIIAPFVAARGQYIAALPDPDGPRARYRAGWDALLETQAELFHDAPTVVFDPPAGSLGADQSIDLIVTFRNAHSWVGAGTASVAFEEMFRVLKPGGRLGVVAHRAPADADPAVSVESGYLPQDYLIQVITAAGFELVDTSEINANPRDTTDHPDGVWSLPPTLRGEEATQDHYRAIGESDRMTLLFRRP